MRRIGVLMNLPADNPEGRARLAAFPQGLQEAGWVVGHNTQIDIQWGGGDAEQRRKQAVEMIALSPDVIFASSNPILVHDGTLDKRELRVRVNAKDFAAADTMELWTKMNFSRSWRNGSTSCCS
jgi:DNA-binding LacI/PurR family transcriptional regulator